MFKFFSEAKQELEHVVWPTPNETKKYMYYTISVIIIMAVLLAITGYVMQTSLSATRNALGMQKEITSSISGENTISEEELDQITNMFSGSTVTEETSTPADPVVSGEPR